MDRETLQIRYLIVITAVLCAVIIGYNAFYVPDISMTNITVAVDTSSVSNEEYTPKAPSSSPAIGQADSGSMSEKAESTKPSQPQTSSGKTKAYVNGKININTATAQQLSDGLDGVGEVMAKRIIEYREKNGSFRSIEETKNVQGIGDKTFEKLKDQITVE
jgi:comEA protein